MVLAFLLTGSRCPCCGALSFCTLVSVRLFPSRFGQPGACHTRAECLVTGMLPSGVREMGGAFDDHRF